MPRIPKKEISCPTPVTGVRSDADGPFKPIPKCDPPVTAPEPDFNPVTPIQGTPAFADLPVSIDLESPEVSVDCSQYPGRSEGDSAPIGSSVIIPAGSFTASVYFQALGLQRDDLYYIAQVMSTSGAAVKDAALASDLDTLCALLNLSATDGQTIIDAVQGAVTILDEQAASASLSALECYWYNDPQVANCLSGSELSDNNPSVVEAGAYRSSYSQADANAKALAAAEKALVCLYLSDEQNVVCSDLSPDLSPLDPGSPDLQQSDGDSGLLDPGRVFNNQSIVEAGFFISEISKEDANTQAYNYAILQLDCFFIQPTEVMASCDPDLDGIAAISDPVTYDGTNSGNPVTVSAGYVISDISYQDTLDQALLLAQSALDCQWGNVALTYSCDDAQSNPEAYAEVLAHVSGGAYGDPYDMDNKVGIEVYMNAYLALMVIYALPWKSPVYTSSVSANTFPSSVSRRDANTSAANWALSQLLCVYCNPEVDPKCPVTPETLSAKYSRPVPGIPYTLDEGSGNYYPPTNVLTTETGWPTTFCSTNPETPVFQADDLGSTVTTSTVNVDSVCTYDNNVVYAACKPEVVNTAPAQWAWFNPETGEFELRSTVRASVVPAASPELCDGSTESYVSVPYATFQGSTQEEADSLARAFALSQLTCFWCNDDITKSCGFGAEGYHEEGTPAIGGHYDHTVHAGEVESFDSKEMANTLAEQLAESLLTCTYCSEEVSSTSCPTFTLPECTSISSVSVADATEKAYALLQAIFQAATANCDGGGGGGSTSTSDSGSEASSGSGGSGGSGGSTTSGSDKSTAIVPAPWDPQGFAALFTHEMPEVRFDDLLVIPITGQVTRQKIDFRYLLVCEPDTVRVDSAVGDTGPVVCARVANGDVIVEVQKKRRPANVTVRLTGIRKGFLNLRFPTRSERQFKANEAFINSAYPRE